MSSNRNSTKLSRRKKREMNRNGDRQFYRGVKIIKQQKLMKWHAEHNPEKAKLTLTKKALAAAKREIKQQTRDNLRKAKDACATVLS